MGESEDAALDAMARRGWMVRFVGEKGKFEVLRREIMSRDVIGYDFWQVHVWFGDGVWVPTVRPAETTCSIPPTACCITVSSSRFSLDFNKKEVTHFFIYIF
jgi:hypothetical protein